MVAWFDSKKSKYRKTTTTELVINATEYSYLLIPVLKPTLFTY